MLKNEDQFWIYYAKEDKVIRFDLNKCGKWMYFFNDKEFISKICEQAIEEDIVLECKHSNKQEGVSCFYINCDDIQAHKKVISFFIKNKLIRRTKTGKLYNISFKLDNQTRAGEYGNDFNSDIKLSNFINLETEQWII